MPTEWKGDSTRIATKEDGSRIYEIISKVTRKQEKLVRKSDNSIFKKWAQDLDRHSSEEYAQRLVNLRENIRFPLPPGNAIKTRMR